MDAVRSASDEVLLCVRRYENEVKGGRITLRQYEHAVRYAIRTVAERCPNLRYIEPCNEWTNDHFGGLTQEQYHGLFRLFRDIIDDLNQEQITEKPLLIGGPVSDKRNFGDVETFLHGKGGAAPMAPYSDFVSYHDYSCGNQPDMMVTKLRLARHWTAESGMHAQAPIFITECGTHEGKEAGNAAMGAGVILLLNAAVRAQVNADLFPWCLYHDPSVQMWSTQILPNGDLTAYGAAMALLNDHCGHRLDVQKDEQRLEGTGIHAIASLDASKSTGMIQLVNYDTRPAQTELHINGASKDARWRPVRIEITPQVISENSAPVARIIGSPEDPLPRQAVVDLAPMETAAWKFYV